MFRTFHGERERGYFLSAGATQGKLLFRGVLLTVKYFYDALGISFDNADTVLVREVDDKGDANSPLRTAFSRPTCVM